MATAAALAAALVAALIGVLAGCSAGSSDEPGRSATTPTTPATEPSAPSMTPTTTVPSRAEELSAAACSGRLSVTTAGRLPAELSSISGLAASRRHDAVFWAIEDSFEPAVLTAVDLHGTVLARVRVEGGPLTNIDWEAIAVGPGPDGSPWVHIGDVGDNLGIRQQVRLHRFPEPDLTDTAVTPDTVTARYDAGRPNVEALVVDGEGRTWVIDKAPEGDAAVRRLDGDVLREVDRLDLPGEAVTAADLSADGSLLAVRTNRALRLHPVPAGGDVADALSQRSCTAPDPGELQGESVAFTADAGGLVTVSEDESGGPVDLHLTRP